MLEIAVDGRTWCGMCPLSVAAEAYVRTSQRTRKLSKCFHPTCFSFLHTISSQHTFLPVHNFPQVFPSTKLSSINHDSHLHLSGFTPLRKIPSVNHYFRNQDFQQRRFVLSVRGFRVSFLLTFPQSLWSGMAIRLPLSLPVSWEACWRLSSKRLSTTAAKWRTPRPRPSSSG